MEVLKWCEKSVHFDLVWIAYASIQKDMGDPSLTRRELVTRRTAAHRSSQSMRMPCGYCRGVDHTMYGFAILLGTVPVRMRGKLVVGEWLEIEEGCDATHI